MKQQKSMTQNIYVGQWDVHQFFHFISKILFIIKYTYVLILIMFMVLGGSMILKKKTTMEILLNMLPRGKCLNYV